METIEGKIVYCDDDGIHPILDLSSTQGVQWTQLVQLPLTGQAIPQSSG
jgi:hypothetical protein